MDFMELLNQILLTVLPLVAVALGGWLALEAKRGIASAWPVVHAWINAHINQSLQAVLEDMAHNAVIYAEHQGYVAALEHLALDKKAVALQWLQVALAARGIQVDVVHLDALIEAAWWEEWGRTEQPVAPAPVSK